MGAILDHLIKDHGATMAEAKSALSGWELRPVKSKGIEVGEIMLKENEVHVAIKQSERNKYGVIKTLEQVVSSLLDEKGFLVTRIFKNGKYKKMIERLGFTLTHSDSEYDYFWINAKPVNNEAIT